MTRVRTTAAAPREALTLYIAQKEKGQNISFPISEFCSNRSNRSNRRRRLFPPSFRLESRPGRHTGGCRIHPRDRLLPEHLQSTCNEIHNLYIIVQYFQFLI